MQTLARLKEIAPRVPVIMLTAHGNVPSAVEAMKCGAFHFATKPFRNDDLLLHVQRAVEHHHLLTEIEALRGHRTAESFLKKVMGPSQMVDKLAQEVDKVASSNLSVLIQGETGTGKELVARCIHQLSAQREKRFVALDSGAIPETLIDSELFGHEKGAFTGAHRAHEGVIRFADGGTLLLDEISNLSPFTQAKLLRVLQEKQVLPVGGTQAVPINVRFLAACNVSLEKEMKAGRFRQDLFFRVTEFLIELPALRGRREDVLYLANRFLTEISLELKKPSRGISEGAAQLLLQYPWPGNVRELRNTIRRAAVLGAGFILPEHILLSGANGDESALSEPPQHELPGFSLRKARECASAEAERRVIRQALLAAQGNKSEAARLLKTDFKTLHLKMHRYGISAQDFNGA